MHDFSFVKTGWLADLRSILYLLEYVLCCITSVFGKIVVNFINTLKVEFFLYVYMITFCWTLKLGSSLDTFTFCYNFQNQERHLTILERLAINNKNSENPRSSQWRQYNSFSECLCFKFIAAYIITITFAEILFFFSNSISKRRWNPWNKKLQMRDSS